MMTSSVLYKSLYKLKMKIFFYILSKNAFLNLFRKREAAMLKFEDSKATDTRKFYKDVGLHYPFRTCSVTVKEVYVYF